MARLWAALLAVLGIAASVQPADVRQWEADAAAAMAYAACLRVEAPPTPTPDKKPDGKPAAAKQAVKPTVKPATKPVTQPANSCANGMCPAPTSMPRRGLFRR